MIMAYTRLAMACPRFGYKIEPQGLLQPRRQPLQIKLPVQFSAARNFLQTTRRLCKQPNKEGTPKNCVEKTKTKGRSKDHKMKPTESAESINKKPKKCAEGIKPKGSLKNHKIKPLQNHKAENKSKNSNGINKQKLTIMVNKHKVLKECPKSDQSKSKDITKEETKKQKGSVVSEKIPDSNKTEGSLDNVKNKPKECSKDKNDKANKSAEGDACQNECMTSRKEAEEVEEITAHVGGMCAKSPCAKPKDPCAEFVKKHIGRTNEPK